MLRRLPLILVESASNHLTDQMMKGMMPLFVRDKDGASHNCGGCSMFISGGDCTVVSGGVSGRSGVCNYWAPGAPATASDKHTQRMTKQEGGYVEYGGKINCSSCRFVDGNYCRLWMGNVGPGDCCISWSAGKTQS